MPRPPILRPAILREFTQESTSASDGTDKPLSAEAFVQQRSGQPARVHHLAEFSEALQLERLYFHKCLVEWMTGLSDDLQNRLASEVTNAVKLTVAECIAKPRISKVEGKRRTHIVTGDVRGSSYSKSRSPRSSAHSLRPVASQKPMLQSSPSSEEFACQSPHAEAKAFQGLSSAGTHASACTQDLHQTSIKNKSQYAALDNLKTRNILKKESQMRALANLKAKAAEEEKRLRRFASRIVLHPFFDSLCAIMITLNSALIGVSTQYGVYHTSENSLHEAFSHVFTAFFLIELVLRMDTLGVSTFFVGSDCKWNWFDFCLVAISIGDFVLNMCTDVEFVNSSFKTIKMLRIIRVFRVFRFFSQLSMLAVMITNSLKSLVWALIMIAIIIYVFAIIFTQNATNYSRDGNPTGPFKDVFGTLPLSVYYLVLSTMDGISWIQISDAAMEMGAPTAILFFFYIAFTVLAVLNVITAMFVDNAIETTRSEREFMLQREMDEKADYVEELLGVFNAIDADASGEISWDELQMFFQDDRTHVYFDAIGVSATDLSRLWRLLDEDESESIDTREFLEGCIRLRGVARSIDVQCIAQRCKKMEANLDALLSQLASFSEVGVISR